jgi:hypothetical protein
MSDTHLQDWWPFFALHYTWSYPPCGINLRRGASDRLKPRGRLKPKQIVGPRCASFGAAFGAENRQTFDAAIAMAAGHIKELDRMADIGLEDLNPSSTPQWRPHRKAACGKTARAV